MNPAHASQASAPDPEAAYAALLSTLRAALSGRNASLVGIHRGGVWVAQRLQADLGLPGEPGVLSTAFHRDDYGRRDGLPASMKATQMPFDVNGADIVLVDDVLFTGRTVRAALNEIFDYGRPASIELAVLLDRGGRELPIEANHVGARFVLAAPGSLELSREGEGGEQRFALTIDREVKR